MKEHFLWLLIFAVLVSTVFTFLSKNDFKERVKYFFYLLGGFVLLSLLAGWLMYPFPL